MLEYNVELLYRNVTRAEILSISAQFEPLVLKVIPHGYAGCVFEEQVESLRRDDRGVSVFILASGREDALGKASWLAEKAGYDCIVKGIYEIPQVPS